MTSRLRPFWIVMGLVFRILLYVLGIIAILMLLPADTPRRVKLWWQDFVRDFRGRAMPFDEFIGKKRMDNALKEYNQFKTPGKEQGGTSQ